MSLIIIIIVQKKKFYVIFNISEFIDIYKLSSHSWFIKFNCQQKNRKHKALCRQAVTAIMKNDTLLARLHEYNVIKTTPLEYLRVVERDISKWKQSHFSFVIIVNNFKKQYFIGFIYCVVGDV